MRRHFLVLTLAYFVALQGIIVAWATVTTMHAGVGLGGAVICSQSHHSDGQGSGDPLPCCLCGPMCCAGGSPAVGAAPQAVAFIVAQPLAIRVHWQDGVAPAVQPAFLSPRQARAPPVVA